MKLLLLLSCSRLSCFVWQFCSCWLLTAECRRRDVDRSDRSHADARSASLQPCRHRLRASLSLHAQALALLPSSTLQQLRTHEQVSVTYSRMHGNYTCS